METRERQGSGFLEKYCWFTESLIRAKGRGLFPPQTQWKGASGELDGVPQLGHSVLGSTLAS